LKIIRPLTFMSPKRVSAWMACNSIRVLVSSWLLNKSGQSLSIKSAERDRRSSSFDDHKVFQLIDGRPIPDWKKFLGVNANKQALLIRPFTFMSPKRVSAWMACNSIRVLVSSWLLNKSGQSLTFEGVKFFVVDGSENNTARTLVQNWDSYKNKGWSSLSSSPCYLPYPGSSCMQVISCSACFNRLRHHILIFWNKSFRKSEEVRVTK
jgi:hypothetical protein